MKIVVRRGTDVLERCAPEWRALEEAAGEALEPFQRLGWARAWMRTVGRRAEPWIVTATEPATALLPLALVRSHGLRRLRFVGHGVSDYLGSLPGDTLASTLRAVGAAIGAEARSFDLLDLQSLHAGDEQRQALTEGLGLAFAERAYERCPVIDTTGDWAAFLSSRKKKFRANLKRAERRIVERGTPYITRETASPALLEELLALERESWKWAAGTAFLRSSASRQFLSAVLLDEALPHEIWTLRVSDTLAAFAIVLLAGRKRDYYLPSFSERFPDAGTWLLSAIVQDSFEGPFDEFDFLRGDESYKVAWCHHERTVHQIVAAGRTPLGRSALAAVRLRWRLARSERARSLRHAALRLAGRLGLDSR